MDMEDLDSCSICMDSYDENLRPRNLPCGHTFCTACINKTIKEEIIECPHCKVPHHALNGSDFPVSFIAEALISKFRGSNSEEALKDNIGNSLSANGTPIKKCEILKFFDDLKESLTRLTESAKTSKMQSEKCRKFSRLCVTKHRDLFGDITSILQINEEIIKEFERAEQKLTKLSEEQELYRTIFRNTIYKLENTTESSDKLNVYAEHFKLLDDWLSSFDFQMTATMILKHLEETSRKTSAALSKFREVDFLVYKFEKRIDISE